MNFKQISRPTLRLSHHPDRETSPKLNEIPAAPAPVRALLVLIRGLPDSGNSIMDSVLARMGYRHLEADMFFEAGGVYCYDTVHIQDAHAWCQRMAAQALARGESVVVSNTFTALWEMKPYFFMASGAIRVLEAMEEFGSVHGVPAENIARMAARWESMPQHLQSTTFYAH